MVVVAVSMSPSLTQTPLPFYPTAPRGAQFIDIRERNSGWRSGDELVIAPTDYWPEESENVTIDRVEIMPEGGDRLFLTEPLMYDHFGEGYQVAIHKNSPTPHDGRNITEMSAEVGLLTHNIVIQGDEQTYDIQFGVHIFMSSPGDESLMGRLEGVEIRDAGQGFFLGRYAVHFHLVGSVKGSYVRKCSIHHSFNRAIAIHGVNHLRVQNNVAYNIRGMTFFSEDGVERFTIMEDNLGVWTRALWSLLVVDQSPSVYWFTNPDSHIRRNVAAGSDSFGFWLRPLGHPDGMSATNKYCPSATPLGSWQDNVAHSTRMNGLRLQDWQPRKNGYYCGGTIPEQAHFNGAVFWKTAMAGVWVSCTKGSSCTSLDHFTIDKFVIMDARHSAFEPWQFGPEVRLENSLMIGKTTNNATLVHDVLVSVRNDAFAREEDLVDENNPECWWNAERPRRYACGNNASHFFHAEQGLWMRFNLRSPLLLSYIHILNYNGDGETDRGVKKAKVYFSSKFDEANKHQWDSKFDPSIYNSRQTKEITLPRATGKGDYSDYYHLDCTGITAQYVAIVPTEYYGDKQWAGLSHVQFFKQTNSPLSKWWLREAFIEHPISSNLHTTFLYAPQQMYSAEHSPRLVLSCPVLWVVCSGITLPSLTTMPGLCVVPGLGSIGMHTTQWWRACTLATWPTVCSISAKVVSLTVPSFVIRMDHSLVRASILRL